MQKKIKDKAEVDPEALSPEELNILNTIRAREMMDMRGQLNIDSFGTDSINGYSPLLKTGTLTLVDVNKRAPNADVERYTYVPHYLEKSNPQATVTAAEIKV